MAFDEKKSLQSDDASLPLDELSASLTLPHLSAVLTHKCRNALTGISTNVQLLQLQYGDDKDLQQCLDAMSREVETLDAALQDFLNFSPMGERDREVGDFVTILKGHVHKSRGHFGKNNVTIQLDCRIDSLPICVNRVEFDQAWMYLLRYLAQRSQKGETVSITVRRGETEQGSAPVECLIEQPIKLERTPDTYGTDVGIGVVRSIFRSSGFSCVESKEDVGRRQFVLKIPGDSVK